MDGLCRYDGSNVTVYKNDPQNPQSISSNIPGTVVEDKEGNIWVNHLKGASCLNTSTGNWINYSKNPADSNTVYGDYSTIRVDFNGNIFDSYEQGTGLCRFDKTTKKFIKIAIDTTNDGFNSKEANSSLIGRLSEPQFDGSMYLMSMNGIFLFNSQTYKRTRVCNSSIYNSQNVFKDHTGKLWLGEWYGGLSVIDQATKTKRNITGVLDTDERKVDKKVIGGIAEYKDVNGKYWILAGEWSTGSIIIVDPVTEKYVYQLLTVEGEVNANLQPGIIYCGSDGKIFITTGSAGILEANPVRQAIENEYTYQRGKPADAFYDNLVRSGIQLDDGSYAFGLLEYNGLRFYDSNFVFKKAIKNYSYKGKIYDLDVRNFLRIGSDKYLLSGRTGIAVLNKNIITPLIYISKKNVATDSIISYTRDLLAINEQEYWVRMLTGGVFIFNAKTKSFTKKYLYADKAKTIPLGKITKLYYDKTGQLWVNNTADIFIYNTTTDEFIKQPINVGNKYLASLYDICFGADNNLWITGDGGLLKYNIVTRKEELLTISDGLANGITERIIADKDSNIWLTYVTGIGKLNTKTYNIKNYTTKDGLPSPRQEYDVAFFVDKFNNLIAGNSGVVTKINIDQLSKVVNPNPRIVITDVQAIDSNISIHLNNKKEKQVTLALKNFPVSINFSIIDFSANSDRKYYYRYAGKDTTWMVTNNGSVAINTITPGTYTMEVTGKINGVFAENIERITFTILPRWFETLWFKIIAFFFSLFILIMLYRWRIKIAKKTESQQTEIQRLSAEQYKNQLELSHISYYFSSSLKDLNTEEEVLWDVAKNLIGKLGFEDCMIYLWNEDKTKLLQKAGYGPKGSIEEIDKQPFHVIPGQGVVGYVAQTKESVLIEDTRKDRRYRIDEMERLSEICVPLIHENELLGIIDSEHHKVNFFTKNHLQLLNTIANYTANKLVEIKNKTALQKLEAEQFKNQLDLSQISNYFSTSLNHLNNEEEVLWDVAKNLIAKLGFKQSSIYLWNDEKTLLIEKAGVGFKEDYKNVTDRPFTAAPGQGVVGHVALTKKPLLINDTTKESLYRADGIISYSELCVPIMQDNEVLGILDTEDDKKYFYTHYHLQQMVTIASLVANKLTDIKSKKSLQKNKEELKNTIELLKGAQLDALRSQMNPHFIFNSLNSIENFILKNEKLTASEYLGKFSKLIRNILDNSKSEKISLVKEIETLQLYIELERIRTNNAFDVVFEIADSILDDNIMLPPMLMQPHAENAILHGIRHLEEKRGKIIISIHITNDDCLEYILEDNGIGRKKSMVQKSDNSFTHKSHGIDITQNRIDLYNQKNNISITYKTIDLYDAANQPAGTKIIILIPLL